MNHQALNVGGAISGDASVVAQAAERAGRMIPPAWPLAATVAVNPVLGHSREPLELAAARLARISTVKLTMPRAWYRDQITAGAITDDDLQHALTGTSHIAARPRDLRALKAALAKDVIAIAPEHLSLPTVADLARKVSGIDWPGLITERFGAWAGGYFDEGQALWRAAQGISAFSAWRAHTTHDLTPEIIGLKRFANHVDATAARPLDAIHQATAYLSLTPAMLDSYFHQLLLTLTGWAQYARYRLWNAELEGGDDETLIGLLAARLIWETALFAQYRTQLAEEWAQVRARHAAPVVPTADHVLDAILQTAFEHARQRGFTKMLTARPEVTVKQGVGQDATKPVRPHLQAAFCIDVRSEIFRRALESLDPAIRTIGFAGFFGLPIAHKRFASDIEERRLPVLLKPAQFTCTSTTETEKAEQAKRIRDRATRAWGRFKLAAVSSFAFVEAAGPLYGLHLLLDSFAFNGSKLGTRKPTQDPKKHGAKPHDRRDVDSVRSDASQPGQREQRAQTAANILRAMSLTENFARLVVLAGHGAAVTNNPHASALHCGACGGYPGDVNARVLAALLNDDIVRWDLVDHGIDIPADTLFIGALHATTTDTITLFTDDQDTAQHQEDIGRAKAWFDAAGTKTRAERASRLPHARAAKHVESRSRDWAETRPEWGLANCGLFVAAPRALTAGTSLAGRAFLHDYDWRKDPEFNILTLILTAPVVVASWISLQYYGSTVAPEQFGAGNKVLHNVVGGFGVFEGNGGSLRTGLPWQSVHDGAQYMHEPLRLSVYVQAPRDAITAILTHQPDVQALFDNHWLHLFALDEQNQTAARYLPGGGWTDGPSLLIPESTKEFA